MKFPTGGKSGFSCICAKAKAQDKLKARERFRLFLKVSRSGVIPGPTVKVRMGESNDLPGLAPTHVILLAACRHS
ncbi:hypothetical protein BN136_1911 [Cronobacter universalis NCTC 9529]|nr:hypothetical protein BN136_1911 [Cronobacter universalis NCTC 9529]